MRERSSETARFGPFRFVRGNGLWCESTEVPLPPRVLGVLDALLTRPGEVVSKGDLLDAGWRNAFVTEASLLEAIRVLRTALADDRHHPRYIQTVHRRGYRFVATVTWTVESVRPESPEDAPVGTDSSTLPAVTQPFFSGPEWRPIVTACVAATLATLVVGIAVALFGPRPSERRVTRFSIALPDAARFDALNGSVAAAADGSRFAFVAMDDGRPWLFVRAVEHDTATRLDGTEDASHPFFSPDGSTLGFFSDGALKIVAATGGTPRTLAPAVAGAGAAWTRDDEIVFGGGPGGGLARVSARGGPADTVIAPRAQSSDVRYGWPDELPDGSGILFTIVTPAGSDVAMLDRGARRYRTLVQDAAFGRYSPTGHLVVEQRGRLAAVPFSLARGEVGGAARSILDDVASADVGDGPRYAFSRSGSLVYVPGPASGPRRLRWTRSPMAADESGADLLVLDRDTTADTRLAGAPAEDASGNPGTAVSPTWRADGLEVAFAQNKTGPFNLFVRPGPGGPAQPLHLSPWNQAPTSWSPDGRQLAFTEFHPTTGADIWVLDVATRTRRPFASTTFDETGARYSPDGRWLAYLTNQSGAWEAVVRPSSGGGPQTRVSASRLIPGGLEPASRGRELRVVLAWFSELTRLARGPA